MVLFGILFSRKIHLEYIKVKFNWISNLMNLSLEFHVCTHGIPYVYHVYTLRIPYVYFISLIRYIVNIQYTTCCSGNRMTSAIQSEKHDILVPWWRQHCKEYSLYYLMKSEEERKDILMKCAPDMPVTAAGTRERMSEIVTATDMLLPELFVEGLQAGNGRCLILFLTRRLASPDTGFQNDIALLNSLFKRNSLPLFSNGAFDGLNTPFVEIGDPNEDIKSLDVSCSAETQEATLKAIEQGRLVHADVWLSCCVRRNALADFMLALKGVYEDEIIATASLNIDENLEDGDGNMGLS